jgi:hypothetical protein
MHFDGLLTKERVGASLVFMSPSGEQLWYTVWLHFQASNNVNECESLVNVLRIVVELGVRCFDIRGDSWLIVGQVTKDLECRDPKMATYCREVRWLEDRFDILEINYIPRWDNEAPPVLTKMAFGWEIVPQGVFATNLYGSIVQYNRTYQESGQPSDTGPPTLEPVIEGTNLLTGPTDDWRTSYCSFLIKSLLPQDETEAWRLQQRAKSFVLIREDLYKKGHIGI